VAERTSKLIAKFSKLSVGQLALLESILETFQQPIQTWRSDQSDVVSVPFLEAFGDILRLHHSLSEDYLDKYRFEAAMCRVFRAIGKSCGRSNRNHPGHDITVDGAAWSLKTQGDSNIKSDILHVSKFMELGKGRWETEADLHGLRDRFLGHLKGYDRIFQLRYLRSPGELEEPVHFYELVEIPKKLLLECRRGEFEMRMESRQSPKPGYCTVRDRKSEVKFQLYFDGGTERKLQIKNLKKRLCTIHATWRFSNSSGPL
jgi:type II restriction enzyme